MTFLTRALLDSISFVVETHLSQWLAAPASPQDCPASPKPVAGCPAPFTANIHPRFSWDLPKPSRVVTMLLAATFLNLLLLLSPF